LDPAVRQVFLPVTLSQEEAVRQLSQETGPAVEVTGTQLIYEPAIIGGAVVNFIDRKREITTQEESVRLVPAPDAVGHVNWGEAETLPVRLSEMVGQLARLDAERGPFFAPVPETANSPQELAVMAKDLVDWLYYNSRLPIAVHAELGVFKRPNESEREFKARLCQVARERRDAEVDTLKQKHAAQIEKLQAKLRKFERGLEAEEAEYDARKREELITTGETVLGFMMGRRYMRTMSRVATKRRLSTQSKYRIEETKDEIAELEEELSALGSELEQAANEISRKWSDMLGRLSTEELRPRRADIDVRLVALAWVPSWRVTYTAGQPSGLTATIPAYPLPTADH
jgi:hypothetical protein